MINLRFSTAIAALGCVLMVSCYPYKENPKQKATTKPPDKTATTEDPQKLKAQEEQQKKDQEELARQNPTDPANPDATTTEPVTDKPKPPTDTTKRTVYPVATKVPGNESCVFSPYNNKLVKVLDDNDKPIPSGTLVADPTYPLSEKKFFRVP